MNRRSSFILVIAIVSFILFTVDVSADDVQSSQQDTPSDEELVNVLRAAHQDWLSGTSFSSHYRIIQGSSPNMDDALNRPLKDSTVRIRGIFNKMGRWLRCSIEYESPPVTSKSGSGSYSISNFPCDEMAKEEVGIAYSPAVGTALTRTHGQVEFIDRSTSGSDSSYLTGPITGYQFGPLRLMGGNNDDPFVLPGGQPGTMEVRVVSTNTDYTTVVLRDKSSVLRREKRVVFWSAGHAPVISEIEQIYQLEDKSLNIVHSLASDFRDCEGWMVPSRVRMVSSQPNGVLVSEWVSDDLGLRQPTEEDFVIEIPPDVSVIGLLDPPKKGTKTRLALAAYTKSDLGATISPSASLERRQEIELPERGWHTSTLVLVLVNVAVLGAVLLGFAIKVAKSKR